MDPVNVIARLFAEDYPTLDSGEVAFVLSVLFLVTLAALVLLVATIILAVERKKQKSKPKKASPRKSEYNKKPQQQQANQDQPIQGQNIIDVQKLIEEKKQAEKERNRKLIIANPPYKPTYLLKESEEQFYAALKDLADTQNWQVNIKTKLIEHIYVAKTDDSGRAINASIAQEARNLIFAKNVDFTITKRDDVQGTMRTLIVCLVELDGESHQTDAATRQSDELKDSISMHVKHRKLVRFAVKPCSSGWSVVEIANRLESSGIPIDWDALVRAGYEHRYIQQEATPTLVTYA